MKAPEQLNDADKSTSTHRQWSGQRFVGRVGEVYTVKGRGGLTREVLIPYQFAQRLQVQRLKEPVNIKDRNINYKGHYNIGGGKGWSHGAHGLRHTSL